MMKTLNCDEDNDITLDKFKKLNEDVLVKHLLDAFMVSSTVSVLSYQRIER